VERDPHYRQALDAARPELEASIADVLCYALRQAAAVLPVAAIVTYTSSGSTSLRAARERPAAPIVSLTPDVRIARRLCLVWGMYAVRIREADRVSEIVDHACATVRAEGLARPGDVIAIAAGMPFGVAGTTNLLRIERLSNESA
jgi:pyruvate kinase